VTINYSKDSLPGRVEDVLEVNNLITVEYLKNWLVKNAVQAEIIQNLITNDLNSSHIPGFDETKINEISEKSKQNNFLLNFLDIYLENGVVRTFLI
jgi:hypothetical protein